MVLPLTFGKKQEKKMMQLIGDVKCKISWGEPIAGVLQELSIKVNEGVFPFSEEMVDDLWAIPHWLELDFAQFIVGFVID